MTVASGEMASTKSSDHSRLLKRVSWVVALGVLLNPLNSSMISVALLDIRSSYGVSIATATWLISSFFLAAAVGQPLMGRFADLFGPRRIFSIGMVLVMISSLLSIWAPTFGWLLVSRILMAFGSTVAFPAGMSIIRSATNTASSDAGKSSASALGLISITANVMAAMGPTLGGLLVAFTGWRSIFWINLPIALFVLVLALRWLPADKIGIASKKGKAILHMMDLPGVVLFSGMLTSLIFFLVSLGNGTEWWLLLIVPITAALLIFRELRTDKPYLDVRMLASNLRLNSVFIQFAGLNVVFYSLFFGLPMWLDQVKGFDPKYAGLLMLPFAGVGVFTTPLAVRIIRKSGYRPVIILGSLVLVIGTLLLLILGPETPVIVILLAAAVIGIPNGLNNMGLQTALYSHTNPEETGAASGLFQTFRSVGSILSTSLLGLIFGGSVTTSGLHLIAVITAVISAGLLAASLSRKLT